jgi:enoyl-[acyl-carrier protein] reductase II
MKTNLSTVLGIRYPIIQGAMVWISDANLVAAMANAGATGVIATGGRTAEWVRSEIRKTKTLTNKPFGVNIMLMSPNKDDVVSIVCEESVNFVTIGAGDPRPYIDKLHHAGVTVIPVVPSVKLAQRIESAGADAIVIEGMEGGGHIGTQTTMALMSNVIPEVTIPVIVAGSIVDGRGIAAALLMGASGVQMGSRFLLAEECALHPRAKEMIIAATDTDSVVTGFSRGTGVRGIRNAFTDHYLEMERTGVPTEKLNEFAAGTSRISAVDGDIINGVVQAGEGLNRLTRIEPAASIVAALMAETKRTLEGASHLL